MNCDSMDGIGQNSRALALLLCGGLVLVTACSSPEQPAVSANRQPEKLARVPIDLPAISSEAFERVEPQDAERRFVDLNPNETGLDLLHIWAPPAKHRNFVNPIFGTGVAIGDYDNDGWQDVFVGRQTDAGRLFRNCGGMKFEDVTEKVGIDPQGMWTSGTTFVDINNDGRLDLYLCGFDCPNRLYINQGDSFTECASEYGLDFQGASIEMLFADYDRDGDLDAYLVTNYMRPETDRVTLKIRRRPGHAPEVNEEYREMFYFMKGPNGNYKRMRGGQYDHFFRNDDGKFVDATESSGIGLNPYMGLSANWWDYNDDGWPDLYVANDFAGPDHLFRNNGPDDNGLVTFTDVAQDALPHTPWYSMGSDFADINNDGRLDYLGSDMAGTNHYRDKMAMGNMSGPDSTAWFLNFPVPPQYMRNSMYLNTGTNRFMEVAYLTGLAKTDWTWTVKFADLDNDGWQDVFFTNGMTRDLFNSDLLNQLKAVEAEHAATGDPSKPIKDVIQDFWESHEPYRLENLAFQNNGALKFKNVSRAWGLDHRGVSTGAAVGDLDNDGDLDIVMTGFEEPVKVYRNDLNSGKSIRFRLIGRNSHRSALGARIKLLHGKEDAQVRYLSNTRGFMSTSEAIAHFGLGPKEGKELRVEVTWPSGCQQVFDSLQPNRLYTLVEGQPSSEKEPAPHPVRNFELTELFADYRHRELEYNDFRRQPLLPNKHSQLGPGMAWGDIDGDGDDDLYIGGAAPSPGTIYENLGGGKFIRKDQDCFRLDQKNEDMAPLFFDADGDGDQDLYVVSGGVECEPNAKSLQDRLYLNDGRGQFEKGFDCLPPIFESSGAVAASDFDRDGDLDLVIGGRVVPGAYPTTPKSYLLKNVGGKFEDVTAEIAPQLAETGMITALIWSDVDGNDWPDLLATTEWGPVHFFRNDAGKLVRETESVGLGGNLGWYHSICGGDIDNDGDTDFVVGNTGLNTKYKANAAKPELLYFGEFDDSGRKRIIEAKFEDDVCLPRRGLSCSSHAMPMVKEKTPTFHEFASSSLSDLYSDEKLESATRYEVNTLESAMLINESVDGRVRFRFKPLPQIAQASPIFGCVLNDFNSDGNLDLVVAQNFYGPQRETGYFDGGIGLLLLGDGNSNFEAIDAAESGFVISGDATSLTTTDLDQDGRLDLVVGRNNASLLAFANRMVTASTSPAAAKTITGREFEIGTKVFLKLAGGRTRLHEVTAGSGYLSQSSRAVFDSSTIERVIPPDTIEVD